jgi:dihydroflavonol-4-reductase
MILVTGGTGLVGSELIKKMAESGKQVRVLFRSEDRLKTLLPYKNQLDFVQGDILDISSLESAMQGVEQVYHSAAFISFQSDSYEQLMKVNVEGTANVVNAMLNFGVPRLLHVSSIAAIGGLPDTLITEETKWEKNPYNTRYGLSKMLAENEVWRGVAEGLEAVIVNPGIILGTGFWEEKNTIRLLEAVQKEMPFYTPGANAYVDVRDVVNIMIQLMDSAIVNERFILASENTGIRNLLELIATEMGVTAPDKALPGWLTPFLPLADWFLSKLKGSPRRLTKENLKVSLRNFQYSNQKLVDAIGYQYIPLSETVRHLVKAYREERG